MDFIHYAFISKDFHNFPQIAALTGDQVLKSMSLWELSYSQDRTLLYTLIYVNSFSIGTLVILKQPEKRKLATWKDHDEVQVLSTNHRISNRFSLRLLKCLFWRRRKTRTVRCNGDSCREGKVGGTRDPVVPSEWEQRIKGLTECYFSSSPWCYLRMSVIWSTHSPHPGHVRALLSCQCPRRMSPARDIAMKESSIQYTHRRNGKRCSVNYLVGTHAN